LTKPHTSPKRSPSEAPPEIRLNTEGDWPSFTDLTQEQIDVYEEATARYARELTDDLDQVRKWIFRNLGSSEMLGALMFLFEEDRIRERDWLVLLGDLWCNSDNIAFFKERIVGCIEQIGRDPSTVIPELMTKDEFTAFDALPDKITIYRGCGPRNKAGWSWSLSREKAVRFPFMSRYWSDKPTLLTATISKWRAAALKLERNEQEVIVIELPETCWTEELITEPPPVK
jgi:hypothetical protein